MHRQWVVIRKNDGILIASFASRYAAMLFSERRQDGPYVVLEKIAPSSENDPSLHLEGFGLASVMGTFTRSRAMPSQDACSWGSTRRSIEKKNEPERGNDEI
jgi:hypothetical protein